MFINTKIIGDYSILYQRHNKKTRKFADRINPYLKEIHPST